MWCRVLLFWRAVGSRCMVSTGSLFYVLLPSVLGLCSSDARWFNGRTYAHALSFPGMLRGRPFKPMPGQWLGM